MTWIFDSGAILPFLIGYLSGSIPYGLLITKLGGAGDVRSIGSGNIGATNVLRTGRKGLAALTLLADVLKGFVVVWFFKQGLVEAGLVAGLGAFIGHLFPIWLKFKGGKGIAVYVGVLAALSWPALLVFGAIWLSTAALTRYSSLAALLATLAVPPFIWFFTNGAEKTALILLLMTIIAWIVHRANFGRLINGTEGKIGAKG